VNTRRAGIDIEHSTLLTLLLVPVMRTQLYVWTKVDTDSLPYNNINAGQLGFNLLSNYTSDTSVTSL